jgi:hypothetical protein
MEIIRDFVKDHGEASVLKLQETCEEFNECALLLLHKEELNPSLPRCLLSLLAELNKAQNHRGWWRKLINSNSTRDTIDQSKRKVDRLKTNLGVSEPYQYLC